MGSDLWPDVHTKAGTVGGMVLVLLTELNSSSMIRTAVLSFIGTIISFWVSMGLNWLVRYLKKRWLGT